MKQSFLTQKVKSAYVSWNKQVEYCSNHEVVLACDTSFFCDVHKPLQFKKAQA